MIDRSRSARLATWLYSRALVVLPAELRAQFQREMLSDFQDLVTQAQQRAGVVGVFLVLLRSCLDLLSRTLLERRHRDAVDCVSDRGRMPVGERMFLFGQEFKLALRGIIKRPGFTAVTVLTLALGIGANVAIFAVVNAVLIRPLPYPQSDRIVSITHHMPGVNLPDMENSIGTLLLYQRHARSFSDVGAFTSGQRNLTGITEPARIEVLEATPSLFRVLSVQPILGRSLSDADAQPGAPNVVVLTYRGWQAHFAGARNVIGRKIELDGTAHEVIGVLPRSFSQPEPETEAVLPHYLDPNGDLNSFGRWGLARLAPGVSMELAQAEATRLQGRLTELWTAVTPEFLKKAGWSVTVQDMRNRIIGDAATTLWIVFGTVGFLLLVACASVANLFLVRAETRHREVNVRFALGATRPRVAVTFLAESITLGLAGGLWGMLLSFVGIRTLVAAGPTQLPRLQEVNVDGTVIAFAIGISLVAGILFGLLPLAQHMRGSVHALVRAGRAYSTTRERQRVRRVLIVAQIALAVVLVTGSGLMVRSFQRLRAVQPGIRPQGVLIMGVSLGQGRDRPQAAAVYHRIIEEIRRLPGVRDVGATNALPLEPRGINGGSYEVQSSPRASDALPPIAYYAAVSDGYLPAIGTVLLQGRAIDQTDHEQKRNVIVVDRSFAAQFPAGRALGQRISFDDKETWFEIVGVVDDVRMFTLRESPGPVVYLPMTASQVAVDLMNIVIRTDGDPLALVPAVRTAIKRVEPNLPVTTARTMEDVFRGSLAEASFTMTVLLIAALVALLLGAIGLYGVINYLVAQRTPEIGVRIALGAVPRQVRTLVLRQGLTMGVMGVALGLGGALLLTRLLRTLLFEVDSRDPLTFSVVPLVMLAVSALAAYLPAQRAARVSPLQALKSE
jgi:predicted permease